MNSLKDTVKGIILNKYPKMSFTEEDLGKLANISVISRYSRNDFLTSPINVKQYFGFIVKGMLKTYFIDDNGKEFIHYFCTDGDMTGTIQNNLYVQALEDTNIVLSDYNKMLVLFESSPVWHKLYSDHLTNLYLEKLSRQEELLSKTAEERYLKLIKMIPHIENRTHQYDIASYLGITSVALSRIKKSLKNKPMLMK